MNQDHSIHSRAEILGFDRCGIARCRPLEERRGLLERWLAQGRHGGLTYMERNLDKRIDPALLVEGARSATTVLPLPESPHGSPRMPGDATTIRY